MAKFGTLDFAVSFNPTTAFPIDARSIFDSYEAAQSAASGAVEVGSADGRYYFGQTIVVATGESATLYVIQPDKSLIEVGATAEPFKIGDGLTLDPESNTLSVNTAKDVIEDNTLPITSGAVYTTVGNINALLEQI